MDLFEVSLYSIKQYRSGAIVYLKNEICNSCNIVLEGEILIQDIDVNGNVLTINEFKRGDVFGENLLFSSTNSYPRNVLSKSDTFILHIKKELVVKLCMQNDKFLVDFLNSVSNKTIILKDKVRKLSIKTIRECIIDFLLYQYKYQNSLVIKLSKSKKELAE